MSKEIEFAEVRDETVGHIDMRCDSSVKYPIPMDAGEHHEDKFKKYAPEYVQLRGRAGRSVGSGRCPT